MDYGVIAEMAKKVKPKMIVCGASAYPREIDFKAFAEIANDVDAYCVADIAHIAGFVLREFTRARLGRPHLPPPPPIKHSVAREEDLFSAIKSGHNQ